MRRIYLLVFLFIVLLSFFLLSIVWEKNAEVVKKRKDVNVLIGESQTIPRLQTQLRTSKADRDLIAQAFPKLQDITQIASYVEQLGVTNTIVAELQFGSDDVVQDADGNSVIPILITTEGSLTDTQNFIKQLGVGKYFFSFDAIDISAGKVDKTQASIQGVAYVSQ